MVQMHAPARMGVVMWDPARYIPSMHIVGGSCEAGRTEDEGQIRGMRVTVV